MHESTGVITNGTHHGVTWIKWRQHFCYSKSRIDIFVKNQNIHYDKHTYRFYTLRSDVRYDGICLMWGKMKLKKTSLLNAKSLLISASVI